MGIPYSTSLSLFVHIYAAAESSAPALLMGFYIRIAKLSREFLRFSFLLCIFGR